MFRAWLSAHKSLATTVTSGSLIAALVATIAVVSGGYDAQRLDLGDGSVWVANGMRQVIGRANTEILALDTVVPSTGTELEVVQDGATVLLFDRTNSKVDIVDPATAEVTDSVPLPPESPELYLAGHNAVIHSTRSGAVWVVPLSRLSAFDATAEPTLSVGADSVASVSPAGTIFLFSREANKVYRSGGATGQPVQQTFPAHFGNPGDDISITSVAGRWILLDATTSQLSIEGRVIDLSRQLGNSEDSVLQEASAEGSSVLVGYAGGLISVPLDGGGAPTQLVNGVDGNAAPPSVLGGCVFAAWSAGTAWRRCGHDTAGAEFQLDGVSLMAEGLRFVTNGDRLVLNDPRTGGTWAVQQNGQPINNWDELIVEEQNEQAVEDNTADTPPQYEKNQLPPVAVDDDFGSRPGRASLLPVLINDYDPNGDVLAVDAVDGIDEAVGRVDVVNDRQQVQLTLSELATGIVSFGYTVTDGRGGTASAFVTVTVRAPGENSPPVQVRQSRAIVAKGGHATSSVLGDWIDPDGDAFYLTSVSTAAPDLVTSSPGGTVVFQEGGASSGVRSVSLAVSDGAAQGMGILLVTVGAVDEVPIIADPFIVLAYAGQEITVHPLEHARGGTGTLRLSSVPPKAGATIEASLETGSFRFTSDEVRTHNLEYVVSDRTQTVTGIIRVDVAAPPDANSTPVTTPKTVFVRTLSSDTIDVASSDIDPAGGVLIVSSVDDIAAGSGVRAEILDQREVRVTLTAPLESGPVAFGYTVTNGLASADGSITVIEIPLPSRLSPPIATDDTITVRVGDAIDIPVLANDAHPDGEELTLNPKLPSGLGRQSGLLFVSGNVLRYLAPNRTGNFTAVYEVAGPDGQVDQGRVNIAVREVVEATNSAPVPAPVIARVLAGEIVRVNIPLTGIDPDGDSVKLLGQKTSPEKGSVNEVGADYIDYLAGDYSAGTDSFTYSIVDALGARATGTVRIGISARTGGVRNPVAIEDEVVLRPGRTVSVDVLANDTDPDGGALSVISVEPNTPGIESAIADDVIKVTPPSIPGRYGLVYTIQNGFGGTSSNFITVIVDPDAPPSYPIAKDTILTLSDILDRDTVNVDVLRNVFYADGNVSSLSLSVLPGLGHTAVVTSNKRVKVTITEKRQIVPFAVANPEDPTVVAYAFVWVPGLGDALPQLDRGAEPLTVASEATLTIRLNDYVLAVGNKRVRITDGTSVQATHANGDRLFVDDQTLKYTSADGYFGPASLSFEVTDGSSANDPKGRKATLVLPIKVTPRENQPPVFVGGVLDFEPGEEKTLDLLRLTTYPYPDDLDELVFAAASTPPAGFEYTLTRATLKIRANPTAPKGTATSLTIGVRDNLSQGQSGRLQLNVVPSTRPLAKPAADFVVAPRGKTTTVDVLANDEAANPFPKSQLSVLAIRGIDGASLPDGMSITRSADNRELAVTVSAGAAPLDTNLQYQVADATGDPERFVYGSVRISVQDRPDAPIAPTRAEGGYEEGLVDLRITAPIANNSPIVKYEVVSTSHGEYRKDCGTSLRCSLTDLVPGLRYQFNVIATNAVGASDSSPASVPLSADYLPVAPESVTAVPTATNPSGAAIAVSWAPVANPRPGSAVVGYTVIVSGPGVDYTTSVGPSTTSLNTTAGGAMVPNAQYVATVYARNSAPVISDADWRRASSPPVTTVGPPSQTAGGVSATVVGSEGAIQVSWGASDPNGGSGVKYSVGRFTAGSTLPGVCSVEGAKPGVGSGAAASVTSGWIDTATEDGTDYQYVVYAENKLFCTPTSSAPVESKAPPGAVSATTSVQFREGRFDLQVGALSVVSGSALHYQAQLGGSGAWFEVTEGQWLTSAADGSVYGNARAIHYRGCRDAGVSLCGPASSQQSLTPVNTRGTIISCDVGTVPISNAPVNANLDGVRFLYSYNDGLPPFDTWTPYSDDAEALPPASTGTGVTLVRLKTIVTISGSTYADSDYAEGTCTTHE